MFFISIIGPLSVYEITEREAEVAELMCLGYTNGDIAKVLFISEYTVKDFTKKLYRKLDVHSRTEAAVFVNSVKYETK